jgi:pSer/pThr/pTyr-binding forkhead associated (FHA) protein
MKSIVGKIFSKKPSSKEQSREENEILPEISREPTVAEGEPEDKAYYKIDLYVHDEKTNSFVISTAADTRIGRDPSQADITIPELIVSKLHCILYFKDDAVFLKDNDSTNGTFVNGQEITEQKLEENDTITLGKKGTVRIVFHKM